jgi:DNA-binding MarR family transcriptional regulator
VFHASRFSTPRRSRSSLALAQSRHELDTFEHALAAADARVTADCSTQEGWLDQVRSGLLALLEFFDAEPALARICVVDGAGPAVLARRREVLDRLARMLDDQHAPARSFPPVLTAQAVVGGVLAVLHAQLSSSHPGKLADLHGQLMSFTVLPFLGARAARRELSRPLDATPVPMRRSAALELLQDPGKRLNHHLTQRVLKVIGSDPGLSNRGVARRAGVKDEGHTSRLLSRLERLGLIEDARRAESAATSKAWRLTASGAELERAITHEPAAAPERKASADPPSRAMPADLLGRPGARLNNRTVSVLRVIAAEPGLANAEVAERIGVKAKSHASRVLARLSRHGLIENTVDTPLPFEANAWRLTASGRELERAVRDGSKPISTRASSTPRRVITTKENR